MNVSTFKVRTLLLADGERMPLSTFVLTMLFYATGRRPCQLRDLKIKDFISARAKDGLPVYILKIPRAKQSDKVYTENVAENVDAISAAVARQLAPTAQAFAGVLVDSETQARRGNDVTSRVKTSDGMSAGTCGKFGFCGALAPFSCYTCPHFQPLLDGPHEQVLQDLVRENERIQQLTGDRTIASINNRTLLAVAEVVELCKRPSRAR